MIFASLNSTFCFCYSSSNSAVPENICCKAISLYKQFDETIRIVIFVEVCWTYILKFLRDKLFMFDSNFHISVPCKTNSTLKLMFFFLQDFIDFLSKFISFYSSALLFFLPHRFCDKLLTFVSVFKAIKYAFIHSPFNLL